MSVLVRVLIIIDKSSKAKVYFSSATAKDYCRAPHYLAIIT